MIWKQVVNKQIVDVCDCDKCPTGWTAAKEADADVIAFRNSYWARTVDGVVVQVHPSPMLPEVYTQKAGWARVAKDGPEVTAHQSAVAARMAESQAANAKRQAVLDQLAALPPEKLEALLA